MSSGVGRRCGSNPALLWLWRRLAAAALIRPLAWESQYAVGVAQEMAKRQKTKNKHDQQGPTIWTGNSTQHSVITYRYRNLKKNGYMHMHN